LKESDGFFTWITDWLGFLPWGQYQWLEVDGEHICEGFNDWGRNDLVQLTELGFLIKISEKITDEEFDRTEIVYKINVIKHEVKHEI